MYYNYVSMSIAKQAAKKILIDAGAERVGDDAAEALADYMNKIAYAMAKKAVALARHAKRKTIKRRDVELAR